jgi:hypothetical protein
MFFAEHIVFLYSSWLRFTIAADRDIFIFAFKTVVINYSTNDRSSWIVVLFRICCRASVSLELQSRLQRIESDGLSASPIDWIAHPWNVRIIDGSLFSGLKMESVSNEARNTFSILQNDFLTHIRAIGLSWSYSGLLFDRQWLKFLGTSIHNWETHNLRLFVLISSIDHSSSRVEVLACANCLIVKQSFPFVIWLRLPNETKRRLSL